MTDSASPRAGDYSSESYGGNLPEKSIYQSDERIFHRAGFTYAHAARLAKPRAGKTGFAVTVELADGSSGKLRLERLAKGIIRLQFSRGNASFDKRSVMFDPGFKAAPKPPEAKSTDGEIRWKWDGATIILGRDPFALRIEKRRRVVFELERGKIAGDYPAAPLGMRRAGDGMHQPYLSWKIRNDERFFGLGEKWNACEKTSTRATIWSSDTCGSNTCDLSYKALPVIFSTRGWGLMLHTGFRTFWEVGTWSYISGSVLSQDHKLDAMLFLGDDLPGLLERYTHLTGRAEMPPRWALGTWMSRCMYENRVEAEEAMSGLRKRDIPADVIHLDPLWMRTHYYWKIGVDACDFVRNDEGFPDLPRLWDKWARDGFTTCLWVNPYIPEGSAIYDEARRKGYLLRSTRGGLARLSHGEPVGMVDFTNPAARKWWKSLLKKQLADGAGVLKPDYGDRVAEDALFHNGRTGLEMHNVYLHLFAQACYEARREVHGRGFVWRRSGWIGSQRMPGTWAGDTQTTWEALRCCLRGGLSAGLTGEPFWASDIGGFVGAQPSPELYIRWMQLGFLSPLTRFHGAGSPREPWHYGPKAVEVARNYGQLRYRLIPYLLAMAKIACDTGLPLMRHMALAWSGPGLEHLDDQYMLGDSLLVAPILLPGARKRSVYLPDGQWLDFYSDRVIEGGGFAEMDAPLEQVPLLVRSGASIPMYAEAPRHLKGPSPEVVELHQFDRPADARIVIPDDDYTLKLNVSGGRLASHTPGRVEVIVRKHG